MWILLSIHFSQFTCVHIEHTHTHHTHTYTHTYTHTTHTTHTTNTHTTHTQHTPQIQRHKPAAFRNLFHVLVVTLMCKLISCSNHSAFFDTKTVGFFLHKAIFSKIHYKIKIYSYKFPLIHSKYFLEPKTSCKNNYIYINKTENKR